MRVKHYGAERGWSACATSGAWSEATLEREA
jgi:hypothetical protein